MPTSTGSFDSTIEGRIYRAAALLSGNAGVFTQVDFDAESTLLPLTETLSLQNGGLVSDGDAELTVCVRVVVDRGAAFQMRLLVGGVEWGRTFHDGTLDSDPSTLQLTEHVIVLEGESITVELMPTVNAIAITPGDGASSLSVRGRDR